MFFLSFIKIKQIILFYFILIKRKLNHVVWHSYSSISDYKRRLLAKHFSPIVFSPPTLPIPISSLPLSLGLGFYFLSLSISLFASTSQNSRVKPRGVRPWRRRRCSDPTTPSTTGCIWGPSPCPRRRSRGGGGTARRRRRPPRWRRWARRRWLSRRRGWRRRLPRLRRRRRCLRGVARRWRGSKGRRRRSCRSRGS